MTLRNRLLFALLSLALLPTLALTLFTLYELRQTTDFWYRPAVDHALESAVEVSRTALTRVEATVLERADDWAAVLATQPLDAARRADLRDGLREAGLDFAQVYHRQGGRWRLVDHVAPAGVLTADSLEFASEIDSALASDRLLRSPRGVLAAVARADSMRALVTGIRLTPDFFARIEQIRVARGLYSRVAVLASLQRRFLWLVLALLGLLLAAGSLLLARVLSGQMTQPLTALGAAFGRVAAGDLGTRVPEEGAAELRSLAGSFNAMTARLSETRASLARAEREAAWREVARRLAHEIKNPLTPMRLSLHRLQKRVEIVPESQRGVVQESLAALLQEVEHLTRLAEQFSQFARLPETHMETLDLAELARAAAALHEPEALTVKIDAPGPVRVRGDRLLVSRALHNLLLNACEASPAGAIVEVACGADSGQGWVEVLDRGPGPPAELGEQVFEPYVSTKNRGSGLGLSLVRDIAHQHQGSVSLEKRAGGGARARLSLPLASDERKGPDGDA